MQASGNPSVQFALAKDRNTEEIQLKELLPLSGSVRDGVFELFQNKMTALWSDLLGKLFALLVDSHFNGTRPFVELRKRRIQLDFKSQARLQDQVVARLLADFSFEKYQDRIRIIDSILNPEEKHRHELAQIRKHVSIRNAIQHHGSRVYPDMLRELGSTTLHVLDQNADERELGIGEHLALFLPELDALKGALYIVVNEWRVHCA